MARKARDLQKEARWRKLVADQRRSGETVRAYCQEHGLSESAFWFWKRELARRDTEERPLERRGRGRSVAGSQRNGLAASSLLPVMLGPARNIAAIEVSLPSGVTLRVPSGCDEVTLRTVLAAVGSRA